MCSVLDQVKHDIEETTKRINFLNEEMPGVESYNLDNTKVQGGQIYKDRLANILDKKAELQNRLVLLNKMLNDYNKSGDYPQLMLEYFEFCQEHRPIIQPHDFHYQNVLALWIAIIQGDGVEKALKKAERYF